MLQQAYNKILCLADEDAPCFVYLVMLSSDISDQLSTVCTLTGIIKLKQCTQYYECFCLATSSMVLTI